jgi:hypothetical protein
MRKRRHWAGSLTLSVDLFGDDQGVIDLDAEVAHPSSSWTARMLPVRR